MKFGVCIPSEASPAFAEAGWDYVEDVVTRCLRGDLNEATWTREFLTARDGLSSSKPPVLAANRLLPPDLKVVGPAVDFPALTNYMRRVVDRAAQVGIDRLVFGSGPARSVPEGFDRNRATEQIVEFCRMAADLCGERRITLLAEPMNRGESNVINSVAEAMQYVHRLSHPFFKSLFDSYHFWLEQEPLADLEAAMPFIAHVHVADVAGRRAPGTTGQHDYASIFRVLRQGGYRGHVTVESNDLLELPDGAARVLTFLRRHATG